MSREKALSPEAPRPPCGTGVSTFCSYRINEGVRTVGTSTCSASCRSRDKRREGDVLEDDPGHVDNLLGNNRQTSGKELHHIRQLSHHLQHRSIES